MRPISLASLASSSGSSPSIRRTRQDGRSRPPPSLRPSSKPSASPLRFVPWRTAAPMSWGESTTATDRVSPSTRIWTRFPSGGALWRGTLIMMFVADEEIDGGGSRALAKQQPTPDLIVIGEPTNNAVFAAHKGCLRPLIRAKGKAAHSGRPELGVNAILAASQLTSLFDARDRELRALNHPLVGHASLSVTRIAGGVGDNVIPESCEMVLDR